MSVIFLFLTTKGGDEDQYGEVRDEHSDEDVEGVEAEFGSTLSANVSSIISSNDVSARHCT